MASAFQKPDVTGKAIAFFPTDICRDTIKYLEAA